MKQWFGVGFFSPSSNPFHPSFQLKCNSRSYRNMVGGDRFVSEQTYLWSTSLCEITESLHNFKAATRTVLKHLSVLILQHEVSAINWIFRANPFVCVLCSSESFAQCSEPRTTEGQLEAERGSILALCWHPHVDRAHGAGTAQELQGRTRHCHGIAGELCVAAFAGVWPPFGC